MMPDEKKYDLAISKVAGIISQLGSDQHQPTIEGKTPQEAWNTFQKRFQQINPTSTLWIIYESTNKKLSDFKNSHKYTSHHQAAFDQVFGFLTDTFSYTCQSTKMFFEATILMYIRTDYSALVSVIQKNKKIKTRNLAKAVLQIIKHFKFIE